MKKYELLAWTSANALGLAFAFVAVLQTGMLIEIGFEWEKHWNWVEEPPRQNALEYVSILVALIVGGVILGSAQALVIRSRNVNVVHWIIAAAAGFAVLAVLIEWPLIASGVLGVIPGPVEPIILTVGGGSFAGIFQYLLLRRQGIYATTWLIRWLFGLVASLVPMVILFMSLEAVNVTINWPTEVFVNGFIVGGVAALVSGKALFTAISKFS